MSVQVAQHLVHPIMVLRALAEARAYLFEAGEFDLGEALEPLEWYAEESGLVESFGPDEIGRVIDGPFNLILKKQCEDSTDTKV